MTKLQFIDTIDPIFKHEQFEVNNLDDEIRIDHLCGDLLKHFFRYLVDERKLPAEQAGLLAHGADYFLKEFIIPDRRENIFSISGNRVRQFAGNWYIVKTLEPNITELTGILHGVEAFYDFCFLLGKVTKEQTENIRQECHQLDFYRNRIKDFWDITGDGYQAWDQACSLRD